MACLTDVVASINQPRIIAGFWLDTGSVHLCLPTCSTTDFNYFCMILSHAEAIHYVISFTPCAIPSCSAPTRVLQYVRMYLHRATHEVNSLHGMIHRTNHGPVDGGMDRSMESSSPMMYCTNYTNYRLSHGSGSWQRGHSLHESTPEIWLSLAVCACMVHSM